MNIDFIEDEYLEHYGVPGMKWGVRKSYNGMPSSVYSKVSKGSGGSVTKSDATRSYNGMPSNLQGKVGSKTVKKQAKKVVSSILGTSSGKKGKSGKSAAQKAKEKAEKEAAKKKKQEEAAAKKAARESASAAKKSEATSKKSTEADLRKQLADAKKKLAEAQNRKTVNIDESYIEYLEKKLGNHNAGSRIGKIYRRSGLRHDDLNSIDASVMIFSNEFNKPIMDEDFLEHHGIKGQQWGKKNGPPYPLSEGDHSAKENRFISNGKTNKNKGLTEKQKKILKTTALVVGTAAVAAGTVALIKNPQVQGMIAKGLFKPTDKLSKIVPKINDNINDQISKEVLGTSLNDLNDLKHQLANKFDPMPKDISKMDAFFNANPNATGNLNSPWDQNCIGCSLNSIFSDLGISSKVQPNVDSVSGMTGRLGLIRRPDDRGIRVTIDDVFPDCQKMSRRFNNASDVRKTLLNSYGEGAEGIIGRGIGNTNHAIKWKIEGGNVIFSDNQEANILAKAISQSSSLNFQQAKELVFKEMSNMSDIAFSKDTVFDIPMDIVRLDNAKTIVWDLLGAFVTKS